MTMLIRKRLVAGRQQQDLSGRLAELTEVSMATRDADLASLAALQQLALGPFLHADDYAAPGAGVTVDCSGRPADTFSIAWSGIGGVPSAFTAVLEGFLVAGTWVTIATLTEADPIGVPVSGGPLPVLGFRSSVSALTLGGAAGLRLAILGTD